MRLAPRRPAAVQGLTGRAMVLGLVLVFLAVVLASPLHRYLAAHSALSQAQAESRQDSTDLTALQRERAKWNDPAFVAQQARERLQYALPGETVYVVVRPGDAAKGEVINRPKTSTVTGDTWSTRLWRSVQAADGSS